VDNLSFFPVVTPELLEKSGCVCGKFDFSYMIDGMYKPLRQKGKSTIKLEDSLETWKVEEDGLRVCRQIVIENPKAFYGKTGVLCHGATMGVCIIWNNRTLTQMGYIQPESVAYSGENLVINFRHEFTPGSIKGDLTLDTVLYEKTAANEVNAGEEQLINEEGVTIGTIDSIAIDFNSLYMDFPIKDVKDASLPLWWLELNQWDDPTQNPFNEDYVCLYLNSYYNHCPKVGDTIKNIDILVEIISTSYLMIIAKIEDMGFLSKTIDDVDLEPGSISKVINYFYTGCDPAIRTESIDSMHKSIRINIEKMLKGGQTSDI